MRHSLVVLLLGGALMAQPPPVRDVYADTWVATDGLGRVLPTAAECGSPRPDKVVGIFYFLWLGNHTTVLHDITQILAADPANPPWGPLHAFHHWGRPRLGYYFMDDPFVIEKHAQMLTDAGVDVVFLDVTNAVTYDATVQRVGEVYTRLRAAGRPTPQFAFLCHSKEGEVAQRLYDTWYAPGKFRELWFLWRGRPLILAKPEALSESLRQYFEVRESWAWTGPESWFGDGRDKWPWLDDYPQKPGWHAAPDQPEQLTVAVASHPTRNIGRSFHNGAQPPPDQVQPDQGLFFAEQWRRVAEVDPQVVFITGWNEWVAQRFTRPEQGGPAMMAGRPLRPGDSFFVDAYTQEFSRDIEPMAGGHGDQYYYQLLAGIRRFKGVRPGPVAGPPLSAPPGLAAADWAPVGPEYRDAAGDLPRRDFRGFGDEHYRNDTGRNAHPADQGCPRHRQPVLPGGVCRAADATRWQPVDVAAARSRRPARDRLGGLRLHRQPRLSRRRAHDGRPSHRRPLRVANGGRGDAQVRGRAAAGDRPAGAAGRRGRPAHLRLQMGRQPAR